MKLRQQIKQNAEAYADKKAETVANFQRNPVVEDFIAGAHSRDEEIEKIKEGKCSLRRSLHRRISALVKEIDGLEDELKKLRNPWISVKERLPQKYAPVLTIDTHGLYDVDQYNGTEWEMELPQCPYTHWMPIPQLKKGELS